MLSAVVEKETSLPKRREKEERIEEAAWAAAVAVGAAAGKGEEATT